MAAYTVASLAQYSAGVADIGLTAVAASDTFANDGNTYLIVDNASGGNRVVTCTGVAGTGNYNIAPVKALTIATLKNGAMGPFPVDVWGQTVTVTYDGTTTTTAAVISVASAINTPKR